MSIRFLFGLTAPELSFQTNHDSVTAPFKATASHKALAIVATRERPPAVMAPRNRARKAAILLFLLGLADHGLV